MNHFWQHVRSGDWLTRSRARGYCLILIGVYACAIAGWIALSPDGIDPNGKPIGTDFSSFYAAGALALEGHAAGVYDMAVHYAREQQLLGNATPYYGWFYPPLFLLIAAPLATLPYPLALMAWQGVTLALYLGVMTSILRRLLPRNTQLIPLAMLAALAFPAVFVNLGHGQNGLLTAALLGGALLSLQRRPILAGLLFGLLAYKPQFALVIPVALIAANEWRAIAAATVSVIVLALLSTLAFGPDIWSAFLASTAISRRLLLEDGDVGFEKLQSLFAAVRMLGGSVSLAYAAQGVFSLVVVASVAWVWRNAADQTTKAALLIAAVLIASPHTLDYDLVILGPAIAFTGCIGVARGFRSGEITLLAAVWMTPLFAREVAGITGIPLGLIASLAFYASILHRTGMDKQILEPHGLAQA